MTTWIANSAGKSYKKEVKIADIFKDGRFKKSLSEKDFALLEEIKRGR